MDTIPSDILIEIFSHIPQDSWFSIKAVSKFWNRISEYIFNPLHYEDIPLYEIYDNIEAINYLNIYHIDLSMCLMQALIHYRKDIANYLLSMSRVDTSYCDNSIIMLASNRGYYDIVKLLLKDSRVDPSDGNNKAIILTSLTGHINIVKLLLKDSRVDPSANSNKAIILASEWGHTNIVNLLLKDPRVSLPDNKAFN
jgi:ankyrin repeat protein